MIREQLQQLKRDRRTLRTFGFVVGGILAVLGLVLLALQKPVWPYLLAPGSALVVLGFTFPKSLKPVYLGWMTIGIVLGTVVSTFLLILIFYLVVTPIGLLARALGKDFLNRNLDSQVRSYWRSRDHAKTIPSKNYERQF